MRWVFIYYSPFSVCGDDDVFDDVVDDVVDVVDDNNLDDVDVVDDVNDTDTPG